MSGDFRPEEALAKLKADAEQARSAMNDFAGMLGSYRDELIENGFSREEALTLCVAWQQSMMGSSGDGDE